MKKSNFHNYKFKGNLKGLSMIFLIFTMFIISCKKDKINYDYPYFWIVGGTTWKVPSSGGTKDIHFQANGNWEIHNDAKWINVDSIKGSGDGTFETFKISVDENINPDPRSAVLSFSVDGKKEDISYEIKQERKIVYETIFTENFSWLKDTANVEVGSTKFYVYDPKELRIDNWPDFFFLAGWEEMSNNAIYARKGFLKMGRGGTGGEILSPKLPVTGTKDLKVEFKAIPYMSEAGTKDKGEIEIAVQGDGEVSPSGFTIENYPDYDKDPDCISIWQDPKSIYSFKVTGATSQTRLIFRARDLQSSDRFLLDDIVVMEAQN